MRGLLRVGIVLTLITVIPFGIIWSLNTLFGLTIPFTPSTWAAALVLVGVVGGSTGRSS